MKRIFMLSSQLLFSRGVENLLCGQAGLNIVGRETDAAKAIKRIREIKPDVVILDSKDLASAPSAVVALILKETPGVTIVALNLENDQIRVYRGEQHIAQNVDDLLAVIDEDAPELAPITSQEWMSLAAGRARTYGFLAAIYNHSVDEPMLANLDANSLRALSSLQQGEDLTGDLREGIRALERFQLEMAKRPREAVKTELAEEYARLLQGSRPEGAPAYACESMYVQGERRCADLVRASVSEAYAKGGLVLPAELSSPPDFIGCELDFMQHLCSSECAAWTRLERSAAFRHQAIQHAFLKDHLVCWVPRFCEALLMQTTLDFYRGIACLTRGFILNEAYRVAELMEWNCLAHAEAAADRREPDQCE